MPGEKDNMTKADDSPVKLLYDQPVSVYTYLKRRIAGWYTVYSYTFVFNLMDWWEQLMMHFVLWTAVGLAAWGIYHQGSTLVQLARSFIKDW